MVFYFGNNPSMDIARIISENLTAWMAGNPSLDTFKKVAKGAHVGFGTIQRAKNGDGNITVEKLTAIAGAFGRHPADLLLAAPADERPAMGHYPPAVERQAPVAREPTPLPVKSAREQRIDEIVTLLRSTDDYGVVAMLEKAKDVARDYPASQAKPGASSA